MEIYIKEETKLQLLVSTPSLEDFQEIVYKVTEIENKVNKIKVILDQQYNTLLYRSVFFNIWFASY